MEAQIQKPYNVGELLDLYRETAEAIARGTEVIRKAQSRAKNAGLDVENWSIARFAEEQLVRLRKATWKALLSASGAEKVMSARRLEQFDNALEGRTLASIPEPNEETFLELFAGGAAQELFREMVLEAFDFLRPGASRWDDYKTNKKNARSFVGKKIILKGIAIESASSARLVYIHRRTARELVQVDKIFHLLDGKPFPYAQTYNSPLVDGLKDRVGQTEYFRWKRYGNGNVHLEFLREDLLKKFNQIAGSLAEPTFGDGAE
ncbi:MAG: DUF4942 domain-containing protein [Chloroflexota bacterium]